MMYVVVIGDRLDVNEFLLIVRDERFVIKIFLFDDFLGRVL